MNARNNEQHTKKISVSYHKRYIFGGKRGTWTGRKRKARNLCPGGCCPAGHAAARNSASLRMHTQSVLVVGRGSDYQESYARRPVKLATSWKESFVLYIRDSWHTAASSMKVWSERFLMHATSLQNC